MVGRQEQRSGYETVHFGKETLMETDGLSSLEITNLGCFIFHSSSLTQEGLGDTVGAGRS